MRKVKNIKLYETFIKLGNYIEELYDKSALERLSQDGTKAFIETELFNKIKESTDFSFCLQTLKNDATVTSHQNKQISFGFGIFCFTSIEKLFSDTVQQMLYYLISSSDSNPIKQFYNDFEAIFYDERLECEAYAPLQGFNCLREDLSKRTSTSRFSDDETEPLIIDSSIRLAPLTDTERAKAHQCEIIRNYYFKMSDTVYGIKIKYSNKKFVQDVDDLSQQIQEQTELSQVKVREQVEDILITLRLYRTGSIYIGGLIYRSKNIFFSWCFNFENRTLVNPFANIQPYSFYLSEDGENFKDLVHRFLLAKTDGKGNLITASRWLSYSCERDTIEDRIINLFIAAEALVNIKDSFFKKDAIAENISNLFDAEKNNIRTTFEKLYKLRNSIIHEGDMAKWIKHNPKIYIPTLVQNGQENIRRGILKSLTSD